MYCNNSHAKHHEYNRDILSMCVPKHDWHHMCTWLVALKPGWFSFVFSFEKIKTRGKPKFSEGLWALRMNRQCWRQREEIKHSTPHHLFNQGKLLSVARTCWFAFEYRGYFVQATIRSFTILPLSIASRVKTQCVIRNSSFSLWVRHRGSKSGCHSIIRHLVIEPRLYLSLCSANKKFERH